MRKTAYFPTPFPDELFYGVIGRYQKLFGYSKETVNEILFSNRLFRSGFDVTCGLSTLMESLGEPYTSEFILKNFTLFSAYYPFLDLASQKEVISTVPNTNSKSVYLKLRLPPSPYGNNKRAIKYCPLCVKNDIKLFGQSYIHRSHQIQYISACHLHGCRLYEYNQPQRNGVYITFDEFFFNDEVVAAGNNHIEIAKLAHEFICSSTEELDRSKIKAKFATLLSENGLLTKTGRAKIKEIYNQVYEYFGPKFLSQYNCATYIFTDEEKEEECNFNLITSKTPHNSIINNSHWIWYAVGTSEITIPLAKYLILLLFFQVTVKDFLELPETYFDLKPVKGKATHKNIKPVNQLGDDQKILELLKTQYNNFLLLNQNRKITLRSLFLPIGLDNFEKYRDQLPLSFSYAESKCRTTKEIRIERCKNIINEFYKKGIRPTPSKVRIICGLKGKEQLAFFKTIQSEIEEYINKKFSDKV